MHKLSYVMVFVLGGICGLMTSRWFKDVQPDALNVGFPNRVDGGSGGGMESTMLGTEQGSGGVREVADAYVSEKRGSQELEGGNIAISEVQLREIIELLGPGWTSPPIKNGEGFGPTLGGVPHGEWVISYPAKNITDTGPFVLGARHGVWRIHDAAGNLLRERTFVGGKIEGELRDRDSASGPWYYYTYRNGEMVSDE